VTIPPTIAAPNKPPTTPPAMAPAWLEPGLELPLVFELGPALLVFVGRTELGVEDNDGVDGVLDVVVGSEEVVFSGWSPVI